MIVSKPKILIEVARYGGSQDPHIKYLKHKTKQWDAEWLYNVSVGSWVKFYLYWLHQNLIRPYSYMTIEVKSY